jgi:hypothetical protein
VVRLALITTALLMITRLASAQPASTLAEPEPEPEPAATPHPEPPEASAPWTPSAVGLHVATLRQGEMVLGLWRSEVGIVDYVTLGTSTPYWIAGLPFATTFPSFVLRGGVPIGESFTLGLRVGLTYFDLGQVVLSTTGEASTHSKVFVLPVALGGTLSVEWLTASIEVVYTHVAGDLAADLPDHTVVGALLYADTVQLYGALEARVSPELAFTFQARYLPYQAPFLVTVDVDANGGETRVSGQLELDVSRFQHSFAALGGIFLTFAPFNLRLAAGYGRFRSGPGRAHRLRAGRSRSLLPLPALISSMTPSSRSFWRLSGTATASRDPLRAADAALRRALCAENRRSSGGTGALPREQRAEAHTSRDP